jgi:hypothetical protein
MLNVLNWARTEPVFVNLIRSPEIDSSLAGRYDNPIFRTGPPRYIRWRNRLLEIDSWAPYTFTNTGSGSFTQSLPAADLGYGLSAIQIDNLSIICCLHILCHGRSYCKMFVTVAAYI